MEPSSYKWATLDFENSILDQIEDYPQRSTPTDGRRIEFVAIHHMGMVGTGNDAANDACVRTWRTRKASAHYGVDGKYVRQFVWDRDIAWALGDWTANTKSVSIEHANSTAAPDWKVSADTFATGARLVGYLCHVYKIGRPKAGTTVRRHRDFMGTSCPGPYLGESHFEAYVAEAAKVWDGLQLAAPLEPKLWKITVPIDTDHSGSADEIYPARDAKPFYWVGRGGWARFRTPLEGATTPGSTHTRTEGREMNVDGSKAKWDSSRGLHQLTGKCKPLELPEGKPVMVIAQFHDPFDDICMLRLDGSKLSLSESLGKGQGSIEHPLLTGVKLGETILTYSLTASPTGITAVVNGQRVDLKRLCDDAYAKMGCYPQGGTGYAEAAHKDVRITHRY